ncbi:uncharacterized protein LOC130756375 isoform X2 [Actinidia eriantha]|uniref:uncharacterized protein LOC130756375 isoform X2 n=1 Tax=Actinidia eriantha TaxID=165200 RepID=UPI002589136C|nr:uncharacterized protein LOC130756375 isoform X2 [Actinidia eriantha]
MDGQILLCMKTARILGLICMVLVLWSPVVVPLLPTLVRSWSTHDSSKFSELACIVGLHASIMILVMLWGKRIRGYENPVKQYGMDFTSLSKVSLGYSRPMASVNGSVRGPAKKPR